MTLRAAGLGLLLAGLALGLGADGLSGPAQALQLDPVPTAAPALAAWRLRVSGKSPLILAALGPDGGGGAHAWPVLQAAHYAGLYVAWSQRTHLLELRSGAAVQGRLVLGEPWLFLAGPPSRRLRLPGPLGLDQGAPSLDRASLRAVLAALCAVPPAWEAPSSPEAEAARALVRPLTGTADLALVPVAEPQLAPIPSPTPSPSYIDDHGVALPLERGHRIGTIVIDPGHGGKDPGAHGPDGLLEKNVCLDIALRLRADLLRRAPHLVVVLTRDRDEFVSLRERTEIANRIPANLFVSIHNNASPNRSSRGTQVFFFDSQTSDRAATDLVSRENDQTNELDVLMTDLGKTLVRDQSIGLAKDVMGALGRALRLKHRDLSYAPFYVLARTKMPAVLIEVAFITNRSEEALLGSPAFREKAAANIATGLLEYRGSRNRAP